MPLTPEDLSANSEIVERLLVFGFELALDAGAPGWFSIDGLDRFQQIGGDGSGGAFVLLPSGHVLHASSEGQAGIIAADFEDFIQLIVARPYWRDILKFSAGGNIGEMRRAAEALEAILDDEDEVNEVRDAVRAELDLPEARDPVGALCAAIEASDAIVRAPDGFPFTTLLNRFTVDDNPMLRDAAA